MSEIIFQPGQIGTRQAPNRLVAQAMEINSATAGGGVSPLVLDRYQQLSRGQWGIVFSEAISITRDHLARSRCLVLNRDNLDGFKKLVEVFKKNDPEALFIFQITHSGRQSVSFSKKVKVYADDVREIPQLTENELDIIREQFLESAQLAHEAGADGIDLKSCHGYLGSELLRPLNSRADRYGGSPENRAFLATSVIRDIVNAYPNFIVGSRISAYEGIRGGCGTAGPDEIIEDFSDLQAVLSHFIKAGATFLNISAGIPAVTPKITRPMKKESFYRFNHYRYAKIFKSFFPKTAIIGSVYTAPDLEGVSAAIENVTKEYVDFVGFGRQNLADPLFAGKMRSAPEKIDFCTFCNKCSALLKKDQNVCCETYNQ